MPFLLSAPLSPTSLPSLSAVRIVLSRSLRIHPCDTLSHSSTRLILPLPSLRHTYAPPAPPRASEIRNLCDTLSSTLPGFSHSAWPCSVLPCSSLLSFYLCLPSPHILAYCPHCIWFRLPGIQILDHYRIYATITYLSQQAAVPFCSMNTNTKICLSTYLWMIDVAASHVRTHSKLTQLRRPYNFYIDDLATFPRSCTTTCAARLILGMRVLALPQNHSCHSILDPPQAPTLALPSNAVPEFLSTALRFCTCG
ncbi:hypothetical protein C2E23DRAFT_596702 [Lenzites betulinus]|nr:hypothetical protein C2E23DRAFT_596702 [Lenzites betulinus]